MMIEEFEELTKLYPSAEMYKAIEEEYMSGNYESKQEFCKAYKANKDFIAERIQRKANEAAWQETDEVRRKLKEAEERIAALEKKLEQEQEWRDYEMEENVKQSDYERLTAQSDTKYLTDDEAKELLYNWYGFAKEKVTIHTSVPIYQVNRHRRLRKVGTVDRRPAYNATDWNYIRFDCGAMTYELYNDNLSFFVH